MRIVYVVSKYPSLTETFIARELEQLVRMGHDVIICPLRPPARAAGPSGLVVKEARVLRCPLNPWGLMGAQAWLLKHNPAAWASSWRDIRGAWSKVSRLHHLIYILLVTTWLARNLQNAGIDYIRGHFLHSEAMSSMWLSSILGINYSLTAHVISIRYPKAVIARAIREAAFVTSDSQEVIDLLRTMRSQDLYLIRNGIDLSNFPFRGVQDPPPEKPVLLAIGSLLDPKGFDVLIQACDNLRQRGVSFICRIIGEGEERSTLEKMAADLDLAEFIQMPGSLPFSGVMKEFAAATMFVMASKDSKSGSDGLPTVIIESMALGLPVVATRKAGIPDLVRDGEIGLIAEPNDPGSLAEAIVRLLGDRDLQIKFSKAGRKVIEEEFDIRCSVSKLVDHMQIYRQNRASHHEGDSQANGQRRVCA